MSKVLTQSGVRAMLTMPLTLGPFRGGLLRMPEKLRERCYLNFAVQMMTRMQFVTR